VNLRKKDPTRRQLVWFSIIFTAFFLVLGTYPLLHHALPRMWSLGLAAAFALSGAIRPGILRRPYAAWMAFGAALGWVNSRVFLTLAYFLMFSPAAVIMRLLGKDPLKRQFEPGLPTYRTPRQARPASHMQHQF
jgi:hypothetical protein